MVAFDRWFLPRWDNDLSQKGHHHKKFLDSRRSLSIIHEQQATPVFGKICTRGAHTVDSRKWLLVATSFRGKVFGVGECFRCPEERCMCSSPRLKYTLGLA
jgi:hypothetical protein